MSARCKTCGALMDEPARCANGHAQPNDPYDRLGHHRVGLGDALVVASAQDAGGVGVLHYNHTDFERLGDVLGVDVIELGPPGTFER